MKIDETKFYWTVAGLLMFLTSAAFIVNDLKRRRTYFYLSEETERQVIIRSKKPILYWMIIGVSGASTLVGFACSPVLMIEAVRGENIVGFGRTALEYTFALAVFFVILYLISSICSRIFQQERLTELGLGRNTKNEEEENEE